MTLSNHNLDDSVARCRTNEEVLRLIARFVEGQSAAEIITRSAVLCGTCAAELASDVERTGGALPDVYGSPDTAAAAIAIAEKLLGELERSCRGLLKSGTFNDDTRRALKHYYEQIRAAHDEIIEL